MEQLERAYDIALENLEKYSELWFRVARSRGFFLLWKDNPNFSKDDFPRFAEVMKRAMNGNNIVEAVLCQQIDAVMV